jgi:hypothetical protein
MLKSIFCKVRGMYCFSDVIDINAPFLHSTLKVYGKSEAYRGSKRFDLRYHIGLRRGEQRLVRVPMKRFAQ